MTRWKIYGPFCSLSLSAEATVTGSIYLGRAAAVPMTALSLRRNLNTLILQQSFSFSSNKSLLKVPEDTAYRSVKRIGGERCLDQTDRLIWLFGISLSTWSFIKLDTCHDINTGLQHLRDRIYRRQLKKKLKKS